jgi:hypothetical protein
MVVLLWGLSPFLHTHLKIRGRVQGLRPEGAKA